MRSVEELLRLQNNQRLNAPQPIRRLISDSIEMDALPLFYTVCHPAIKPF